MTSSAQFASANYASVVLGINLAEFVQRYNDVTRDQDGAILPAVVTVYEDRSFDLATKTPTTAYLLGGLRGWRRAPVLLATMGRL